MPFYTTGLSSKQRDLLIRFGKSDLFQGFYLGGGTALTIYYGHRCSVDLDWFTPASLENPLQFAQLLRDGGVPFVTESIQHGTLHGTVDKVRISFLVYNYPLINPLVYWNEGGCFLASLDDLACMKLAAVAQRGARKDFIDIYILLQRHRTLEELVDLYVKKYVTDNLIPVLKGLVYFDDAENDPDPLLWSVAWSEVKRKLRDCVKKISV